MSESPDKKGNETVTFDVPAKAKGGSKDGDFGGRPPDPPVKAPANPSTAGTSKKR